MSQTHIQDAFDLFYSDIWKERWPELKQALLSPNQHVGYYNSHFNQTQPKSTPCLDEEFSCYTLKASSEDNELNSENILKWYFLDYASVFPVKALNIQRNQTVLDMCAAPGGKTLLIEHKLENSGLLQSNELSTNRFHRLKKTISDYIPEQDRIHIHTSNSDATQLCLKNQNQFDRVLLDAPCSSERHVLNDPKELQKWKPSRTKFLAKRQYALLSAALLATRPGGLLVYSTCSISPIENDGVVSRLLKKKTDLVRVIELNFKLGEKTEFGWQILPDKTQWGPIYFSILQKN